jgi:ribosome-binding protein aMBF1 (putative translation factor)
MTRMQCDYCQRIINRESSRSIPCIACGHGHLREMKPKNWCSVCKEPQYDNLDPKAVVVCDKCFGAREARIRQIETELRTDFIDTADAKRKCERYVLNKGKRIDSDLRVARKAKGWSQEELGIHLGVSKQAVQQMESGKRPYGGKAKEWLEKVN